MTNTTIPAMTAEKNPNNDNIAEDAKRLSACRGCDFAIDFATTVYRHALVH